MIETLANHYIEAAVSVFSILLVLQVLKAGVQKRWPKSKDLWWVGLLWWLGAWGLGAASALLTVQCGEGTDWRCWANPALVNGGIALILYPRLKPVTTAIWQKLGPKKAA